MGHRAVWLGGARGLEHDAMPDGVCTDRPSGPPDCVSNRSSTMSRILSNYSGPFGLVVADGNSW